MNVKRLAVAAAIGASALMLAAPVGAVPLDPAPPCVDCQPEPGGPEVAPTPAQVPAPSTRACWPYGRVGPGGPRGGGGQPAYPPPCH